MPFDKEDFIANLATAREKRARESLPQLRVIQAQAQVMEKLLVTPEWNRYLSYLQELVNKTEVSKASAQARQNDPAIWDPQQLAKLKSDVLQADAMLQAWDVAMRLPKLLIEDAEKAAEMIAEFGKEDAPAGQPQS